MRELRLDVSVLVPAPAAGGPVLPRVGASARAAGGRSFEDAKKGAQLAKRCGH